MSSIHDIKYLYENAVYAEGAAAEHPDIAGQKEFASKADEILARRKRDREQSGKNAKLDAIGRKLYNMNKIGEETELEEGMTMKDFKQQRSRQKQKEKRAAEKTSPTRRSNMSPYERAVRHRANVDPDYDHGDEERDYPGGMTKNPKKVRKAKALGELGEAIDVGADVGATISDFVHSKSKTFKGDSKKERIKRALGAYYAAKKAQKEEVEVTEEIENLEEKARGTKPKRTVHAYDVDETLFSHGKKGKPNVQVHVKDSSGKRVQSLSNQEFNTHKLQKGHSYDFSEFQSAKKFKETSSPNKKVIKHLQKQVKRGENVHLITARSKFDDPKEFHGHLKKHGIDVPMKNIHYTGGMKGGDIGDKKVKVANAIAKQSGTSKTHMYDDAAKVHKSFEAEKQNKPTSTKIKTHLVKPNKEGTPMSRSYQATKEELLIKFPGKENIQNENKELSPYEYWNTFIRENKVESQVIEEQVQEEVVIEEETDLGSYSYWKSVLQEGTK